MTKKLPTKAQIHGAVKYVANEFQTSEGQWFSVMGGHGWSQAGAINPGCYWAGIEAFDWAAKLGFLDASMTQGSGGYVVYRLTRLGKQYAERLLEHELDNLPAN